uniref:R-linalool synthase QH1, chloroplastic-like n=1 Tax=Tanacetum cinerariifolium TaxID=118510 RepID=A0A6L2JQJ4_TANCI|nr:R-linalool synthase QH1, chloroplastic-like [Tanacetum cinerariifolium]
MVTVEGIKWHYNGRKRTNIGRFPNQLYFTVKAATTNAHIVRRSANYPPSVWSHDYLESLTNKYVGVKHETTLLGLKEMVRRMISEDTVVENPLATLELIDDLQRLGLSYHFEDEISTVLKMIYICYYEAREKWNRLDLNLKAVGFRLLRQYSYHIPQEIFDDIKDETGNFKACVREDVVGMLNLYEASFLGVEDEKLLDGVREFTTKCLREKLEKNDTVDQSISMLISHALELPLLWRVQRFEAMWFMEAYKRRTDMKPFLLELAELDFNIVQGIHQEDLKRSSRHVLVWWDGLCWNRKLSFARDRLVESFMWAAGANFEPQHGVPRIHVTKLISLVNVIDDVYDVYGTLDELEQFTEVVRRWDVNKVEGLPDYMKICFLGFHNTINEMAYNTLINQKSLVIPYVKKVACVREDVVGMLNLYEASFLGVEDEKLLDGVREFTTKCLREKLEKNDTVDQSISMLISHALELPLLWRVQRFEAMWFMEAYKRRTDMKPFLLELAELDFNIVQGIHQEDLKRSSRHVLVWWDGLCWNRKLSFARDRLVESFMWAAGANFEPQHGVPRIHVTKLISLVNVIDDVYDVYGTLDELEQFTEVVRRWDVNKVEGLPDYMKICFLGFHNTINEMAYNTLINQKSLVIPYNVIHWSAMILRLADDLGTSSAELERGDIPKSIQCYMHETGATEEKARAYIKSLIMEAWKKINKERMFVKSPSLQIFLECASNIGRMGQFTYERGDIFGAPDDLYKSHASSLLFDPKS